MEDREDHIKIIVPRSKSMQRAVYISKVPEIPKGMAGRTPLEKLTRRYPFPTRTIRTIPPNE